MSRTNTIISLASAEKILRNAGAERVSDDASLALVNALIEYGTRVSQNALVFTKVAKRSTIKEEDIKLAIEGTN